MVLTIDAPEIINLMNPDLKNYRKQLLRDPIAAFTAEYGDTHSQKFKSLEALWVDYRDIKTTLNDAQKQQRQIAREIGIAKSNGISTDLHKQQMQECSIRTKYLANKLRETEEQIFGYFDNYDLQANKEISAMPEFGQRQYPNKGLEHEEIIISRLEHEVDEWNCYVEQNPAASFYHRAEWKGLIANTFDHEGIYLLARNSVKKVVGILPLIRLKSRLFGDFLVSMPYFNYGGAVADSALIEQRLMNAANEQAEYLGVQHIEYRDDIKRDGYPARTDKVNMILGLPKNEEILWDSFSAKLRAQIRRPQRENAEVQHGGCELLDDFYTVFTRNMRDLGTPVYSRLFFANILNDFSQYSRIIIVKLDGRPVSSAFLVGHNNTMEIPWASSIREVNHLSMNMLMYWEVLRLAINEGYQYFDFGRSSIDSGTYRFKQQWGAIPKPLCWHYWLPKGGELPALNPSNPKYALMINVWRRLPVFFTRWLGPKIVKNLP